MAKNKGKFGKGKSEVELDDQFISTTTRLAETLKPYVGRIVVAAAVVALLVVAFTGYRWWDGRKEARATHVYAEAVEILARTVGDPEPPPPDAPDLEPEPTFPTVEARAQAAIAVLERLQASHGGTRVAREARVLEASVLLDLGRADEALALYEKYAAGGKVAELRQAARLGAGYAHEARAAAAADPAARQAALEQALAAFSALEGADALYHRGRVLTMLNRGAEARDVFEQALEASPGDAITGQIQYRLAQLEPPAAP